MGRLCWSCVKFPAAAFPLCEMPGEGEAQHGGKQINTYCHGTEHHRVFREGFQKLPANYPLFVDKGGRSSKVDKGYGGHFNTYLLEFSLYLAKIKNTKKMKLS